MTAMTLPAPRRSNIFWILFIGMLGVLAGWTALGCIQSALDYQRQMELWQAQRATLAPFVGTFCDKTGSNRAAGQFPVCGIVVIVCRQHCSQPNAVNEYYLVAGINSWRPVVLDQHDNKLEQGLPKNCWFQKPDAGYRCTFVRILDDNWKSLLRKHFTPFIKRLYEPPPQRRFSFIQNKSRALHGFCFALAYGLAMQPP